MFHLRVHGVGNNQNVYFMNSLSFLSEPGYVVLFGSLFIVLKQTQKQQQQKLLNRTTKLILYLQLLRSLNL